MLNRPILVAVIASLAAGAVLAPTSVVHAQEATGARGKLRDAASGKPVAGATVFDTATGESAISDDDGNFALPPGTGGPARLVVIDPSYAKTEARFDGTHAVTIALEPVSVQGEEIVIEAERARTTPGETTLAREEITRVPGARGDALAAVKNLPGVANMPDLGGGGLVVRGAPAADSRIFVDGFEIPLLYHFGGVQSVLPTEMIDDLVFSPGAFGVELGRASGGAIQVASRRGAKELAGFAELSFINAATMLQGPIGTRGSFAIAARRSYIDALIPLVVADDDGLAFTALPRYYDYQARADYALTPHLALSAFLFGSDDLLAVSVAQHDPEQPSRFRSATRFTRAIAAATYDRPGVYAKLAASALTQVVDLEAGDDRFVSVEPQSLAARHDARIQVSERLALIAGAEAEAQRVDLRLKLPRGPREGEPTPIDLVNDPVIELAERSTATNLAGWAALELVPHAKLKVTAGVRVDNFRRNHVVVAQPRVQARLQVDAATSVFAAGGLYTRPPHADDEYLQPSLEPEHAWQASAGIEHKLAPGVTLTATAYDVERRNLIVAAGPREQAMRSDGSDAYTNAGRGRSYGAELRLQARGESSFGWVAYTFARSFREDGPMAETRLFDSDQTHNLVVLGSRKLGRGDRWQIGGRFQLTTGTPYTPVTGAVFNSDTNTYRADFGAINSRRNPAQHQLDIRIDRSFAFKDWKLSGYLDIANVYMNAPVLGHSYNPSYTERTETKGIPILPSLGVRGEL